MEEKKINDNTPIGVRELFDLMKELVATNQLQVEIILKQGEMIDKLLDENKSLNQSIIAQKDKMIELLNKELETVKEKK
jgi:hypothetical protein